MCIRDSKHILLLLQNQPFEKFPSRHGNPWKTHADMLFKAFGRFRESADQQPSHFAGNCVFASESTGPRVGEGNQSRYDETETTKNRFRNPNNACSAILVICRIPGSSRGAQNHVFPKENLVFMHFIGFAEVGNTILTHTYVSKCIFPGPAPTN